MRRRTISGENRLMCRGKNTVEDYIITNFARGKQITKFHACPLQPEIISLKSANLMIVLVAFGSESPGQAHMKSARCAARKSLKYRT